MGRGRSSATGAPTPAAALDGGYGWVVTAASFLIMVIVDGVCFTVGIFLLEFLDYYGGSKSEVSWVASVLNGTYLTMGPIVSALTNVFGCRKVTIAGGLVSGIAFAISIFSPNVTVLILTYGFLGGVGFGLMYLPGIVIVGFYFDKRRALATGIAVCGSGMGAFLFAPLVGYLLQLYGWKGAILIIAGISLNGMVLGGFFRPLEDNVPLNSLPADPELKESNGNHEQKTPMLVNSQEIAVEKRGKAPMKFNNAIAFDVDFKNNQYALRSLHDLSKPDFEKSPQMLAASMDNIYKTKQTETNKEYYKPLSRTDIFYSGSVRKIPEIEIAVAAGPDDHMAVLTTRPDTGDSSDVKVNSGDDNMLKSLQKMMDYTLLLDPVFLIYGMSCFLSMIGFFVPFIFLPSHAVEQGSTKAQAAILLSVIGISNTIARVVCGIISDLPKVDCLLLNNLALIGAGVATVLCPHCYTYILLVVYAAVFGCGIAVFISLRSIIMVEMMGLARLTSAFGLVTLFQGLSSFVGAPIAGALYDATGDYTYSFYVAGGCIALAGLICLPLRRVAEWQKKRIRSANRLHNALTD